MGKVLYPGIERIGAEKDWLLFEMFPEFDEKAYLSFRVYKRRWVTQAFY
jgi:hypothetical protein